MKRPEGSNADEWHMFLREYVDLDCNPLPFLAVQIAEAIEERNAKLVAALTMVRKYHVRLNCVAEPFVDLIDMAITENEK